MLELLLNAFGYKGLAIHAKKLHEGFVFYPVFVEIRMLTFDVNV